MYVVLVCPKCLRYFYKELRKYSKNAKAKCPYCGHTFKIFPKRDFSRIVKVFDNPRKAREYMLNMNKYWGEIYGKEDENKLSDKEVEV